MSSRTKSPGPRRSSRQSTPTRSPPPSTGRKGAMPVSASTPSLLSSLGSVGVSPGPANPSSIRKSASSRQLSPAPLSSRPSLPVLEHSNKLLIDYRGKLHRVKIQTLHLGGPGDTITIARVKCPVPKGVPGHIIKRFDTNAVSASSLYRAAFPTATEQDEAAEMNWIIKGSRGRYGDTRKAGSEHDETRKLSGTWIPASHAYALAEEYAISKFASELIGFKHVEAGNLVELPDSENDNTQIQSPRSKRQRLTSPPHVTSPLAKSSAALSGSSTSGVSILQTLTTDGMTGVTTETTEIKVDVPVPTGADRDVAINGLVASDALVAEQIEQAKLLVESLKETGTLQEMTTATKIESPLSTKKNNHKKVKRGKRALEDGEEDEDNDEGDHTPLPTSGTLADLKSTLTPPVDTRGFFGKLFKRAPKRTAHHAAVSAREKKALPSSSSSLSPSPFPSSSTAPAVPKKDSSAGTGQLTVMQQNEDITPEGRRWVAGLGLGVAVAATAAAPYLFG